MPLFDYRCKRCDSVTEVLVRGSGDGKPVCESCGGDSLERLLSPFSTGGSATRASQDADPSCRGMT